MSLSLNQLTLVNRCMELISYDSLLADVKQAFIRQSLGNRSGTNHAAGFVDEEIFIFRDGKITTIDVSKLKNNHIGIIKTEFEEISFNCQHKLLAFNCQIKTVDTSIIAFSVRYDWDGGLINDNAIFFGSKDDVQLDDKSLNDLILITLLKLH